MKKIILGLGFFCGVGYAQTVQDINSVSAFSNDLNAGSARYIGMGGSMGALGGDISSIEQNPAGLALAITTEANVTLGVISYKNNARFGNSMNADDNDFLFTNIGGVVVFHNDAGAWNRFSIGMKYSQESLDNSLRIARNNNITMSLADVEDPDLITNYTFAGYQDEIVGYKTKMTLDFGASYNDRLYLGLGLNLHDTHMNNYVVFDEDTNGTVYRYDLNGTPYATRGPGVSLSLGAIGKVNDNFRLGLAYHSPAWYGQLEEEFLADLPVTDSTSYYDWYYSQYDRTSNGRLVGSAGLIIGKSVALNVDYTYHMNGSTKLKPSGNFQNINNFLDDYLKNNSELRIGGEYRLNKFKFRAGYNYIQTPFDDVSLVADLGTGTPGSQNFSEVFRGDTNRFSLGAGYDFGGFYLDAAYQFQTQKYKYVFGYADYVDYDVNDDVVYYATLPLYSDHNYVADVEENKGMFVLTAGWHF